MKKQKTFYIVDGFSQIFRAYYAPAAFRNRGAAQGATYIFTRMLLKLLQKGKPTALVCALDSSGQGSVRNDIYPDYKANRDPMPEELAEQLPSMRAIIEAMGIPIIEGGAYEADDVIGTLAQKAEAQGYQVRIVSRDKDLKQLLSENTYLYDVDDGSLYGPEELEIDLGLKPQQFIDFLALAGDKVDNIPGVPGVGPKRAQALLQEHGSLEEILKQAESIKQPKMRENLIAFREQAPVSRQLATIYTDIKLELELDDALQKELNRETLEPLFKRFSFRSLLQELGWTSSEEPEQPSKTPSQKSARSASTPQKKQGADLFSNLDTPQSSSSSQKTIQRTTQKRGTYTLIDDSKSFQTFLKELRKQKRFAFDTETTSLNPFQAELVGISISWQAGQGYYIALKGPEGEQTCDTKEVLGGLQPILEDPAIGKVGQNLKYDLLIMRTHKIRVQGVVFDTMIGAYLADNTRQEISLDQLAHEYLNGYECIPITQLIGEDKKNQKTLDQIPIKRVADYAGEDADISWQLFEQIEPELEERSLTQLSSDLEMPLVEVLAEMEYNGIRIDKDYLETLSKEFLKELEKAKKKCFEIAGREFTINSPKQLAEILFDELGLQPQSKTAKGARSTSVSVLERLAHEHPLPEIILRFRHLSKLKATYVDSLPKLVDKENRVHTTFRQAVSTGRLASNDPNVQNIPIRTKEGQKIRKAFVAQDQNFCLVVADYSQIELRILAHLCEDKTLRQAFLDKRDIHKAVASEVYGVNESEVSDTMRSQVKAIHFGILYGQSAFSLSQVLKIPRKEALDFIKAYFQRFPKVQDYITQIHTQAQENGYVTTILGRRRYIPGAQERNRTVQAHGLRQAFNTVTQGSAADLIKMAMLKIYRRIQKEKQNFKLLIQVHDELILEVPKQDEKEAKVFLAHEMENALQLEVPLHVEVGSGPNWLEAKA